MFSIITSGCVLPEQSGNLKLSRILYTSSREQGAGKVGVKEAGLAFQHTLWNPLEEGFGQESPAAVRGFL